MRLIQDHKRVVERAATHEGERRHLDGPPLDHFASAVEVHHVVERIVERPQIGVDLLGQVAREETELLASLDGRAGEYDATHFMFHQLGQSDGHGQIRFTRTSWTYPKDNVKAADGVDVGLLRDTLGRNRAAVGRDVDGIEEDVAQVGGVVTAQDANGVVYIAGIHRVPTLQEPIKLSGYPTGQGPLFLVSGNDERGPRSGDLHS